MNSSTGVFQVDNTSCRWITGDPLGGTRVTTYELIFEIDPIEEPLQDKIDEQFDALMSTQGASFFVTVGAEGGSAADAALGVAAALAQLGVNVRRMAEDLVTRTDIAERTGKTPQAVGAWVRGDRQAADPFPPPYNYVAGGVWLWSEVNEWLARIGGPADDVSYPSRQDYALVNHILGTTPARWMTTTAHIAWAGIETRPSRIMNMDVIYPHVNVSFTESVKSSAGRKASIDESWNAYTLAG